MLRNILSIIYLTLLMLPLANAGTPPVDEIESLPGGITVSRLVDTFRSSDEAVWREFIDNYWAEAPSDDIYQRRLGFFKQVHGDLGNEIFIRALEESTDSLIAVLAEAINPPGPMNWFSIQLMIEKTPPHRITLASIRPADDPGFQPPEGDFSDPDVVQFLNDYIDKLCNENKFSGTVMVTKDGKSVYSYVCGSACMRYDIPNRLDTKINLGSMNKMFTGVAICQLAEKGFLSFDDPIIKHLPDYPLKDVASKVTIRHLLTHTSGMGDYWDELFDSQFWKIKTVRQIADLIIEEPLEFEPGERFRYSNSGPIILGLIIEKISGESYYEYIAKHIYESAGMINSGCFETDTPVKNLAIGYTQYNYDDEFERDHWYNNYYMHSVKGGPAGGGYSTVEDLTNFASALTEYRLLSKAYTDTLTTGKVDRGGNFMYAFLFGEQFIDENRVIGHSGGAPGISANLDIFPDLGYSAAVLSNYGGNSRKVVEMIQRIILGD